MQRLTNIEGYANPTDGLFVKGFGEVPSNQGFESADLLEFLNALTAPNIGARLESTIPSSGPSGLQVDEFNE